MAASVERRGRCPASRVRGTRLEPIPTCPLFASQGVESPHLAPAVAVSRARAKRRVAEAIRHHRTRLALRHWAPPTLDWGDSLLARGEPDCAARSCYIPVAAALAGLSPAEEAAWDPLGGQGPLAPPPAAGPPAALPAGSGPDHALDDAALALSVRAAQGMARAVLASCAVVDPRARRAATRAAQRRALAALAAATDRALARPDALGWLVVAGTERVAEVGALLVLRDDRPADAAPFLVHASLALEGATRFCPSEVRPGEHFPKPGRGQHKVKL